MFFLIRTAFWLSIVIMLLPTPQSMKAPESNVGATQAISAASATVSDVRQFCARQPDACEVGSAAHALATPQAAEKLADVVERLADRRAA